MKKYVVPAAAVAAIIAVSSTGGAVAGSLITGAQIKDGTITGADVKNGSLQSGDLSTAARSALTPTRIVSRLRAIGAQDLDNGHPSATMATGTFSQSRTQILLGPVGTVIYTAPSSYCPNDEQLHIKIALNGSQWDDVSVPMTIDNQPHKVSWADLEAVRMEPGSTITQHVVVTVSPPGCTGSADLLPVTVGGLTMDVIRTS